MRTISKEIAKFLISESNGKFFTAKFVKKDGLARTMNARLGVKKYLTGQGSVNRIYHNLIIVFDVKKGYRQINLETLFQLKINGKVYSVV